ncbi:hypothetical protein D3C87_324830 [compost metagenome]
MGYSTRNNGQIETFWPDDKPYEFYMAITATMEEIQNRCKEQWPEYTPEQIQIFPERIHTDCLTYDLYDSCDYTYFLRIENISI